MRCLLRCEDDELLLGYTDQPERPAILHLGDLGGRDQSSRTVIKSLFFVAIVPRSVSGSETWEEEDQTSGKNHEPSGTRVPWSIRDLKIRFIEHHVVCWSPSFGKRPGSEICVHYI